MTPGVWYWPGSHYIAYIPQVRASSVRFGEKQLAGADMTEAGSGNHIGSQRGGREAERETVRVRNNGVDVM